MKLKKLMCAAVVLFTATFAFALKVPALTGPVVDNAGLLSSDDYEYLTELLSNYDPQAGAQIAVLTVPSLEGESIEGFAYDVAKEWKIGSKEYNNGVILIIALNERKIRIHTGYGVEDTLTDVKCGLIIRNVIAPCFQNGDYGEGIVKGVQNIAGIIGYEGVEVSKSVSDPEHGADSQGKDVFGMFFVIWFILVTGALSSKFPGLLGWLPWAILFRGSRGGSGSSHYSSHHSSFGGGSRGGGFSGGGGGFGGGGASGGW